MYGCFRALDVSLAFSAMSKICDVLDFISILIA